MNRLDIQFVENTQEDTQNRQDRASEFMPPSNSQKVFIPLVNRSHIYKTFPWSGIKCAYLSGLSGVGCCCFIILQLYYYICCWCWWQSVVVVLVAVTPIIEQTSQVYEGVPLKTLVFPQ